MTTTQHLQSRIDRLRVVCENAMRAIRSNCAKHAHIILIEGLDDDDLAAKEAEKCSVCGSTVKIDGGEACGQCGEDLPSVAGRMEMTHGDFQKACRVAMQQMQQSEFYDKTLFALLCEAVRCSRECCELAAASVKAQPEQPKVGLPPINVYCTMDETDIHKKWMDEYKALLKTKAGMTGYCKDAYLAACEARQKEIDELRAKLDAAKKALE